MILGSGRGAALVRRIRTYRERPIVFPDNGFISCRYLNKRVIRAPSQTLKVPRNLIDLIHAGFGFITYETVASRPSVARLLPWQP